jgi:predicted metalloprotease with PDZ domain
MAQTDSGVRPYTWIDIKAALHNTADADWEAFYQSYIKGHEPLPLDTTLSSVGLRLTKLADGSEQVEYDPAASFHGKDSFRELIGD